MQKTEVLAHAAKFVALCLPPVLMSLAGLAVLSRKKGPPAIVAAAKRPAPTASAR